MTSTTELFSVKGKTVLITGGSRGIGYMMAEGYLRAGAKVYISSRKADACEAAVAELSPLGDISAIPADVADPSQCEALISEIGSREDALHVLVNNAGATWGAPFDEFPDSGWNKVLAVNLKAPFVLTKLARPLLEKASKQGDPARVINIGSIDGLVVPMFENYSYSSAKAGVHQLTRHLASALSPTIWVNAIAPGPFPTKMLGKALEDNADALRDSTAVGRLGEPDDIIGAAIYLSSPASSFVTGAVIPVDGGISTTAGARA